MCYRSFGFTKNYKRQCASWGHSSASYLFLPHKKNTNIRMFCGQFNVKTYRDALHVLVYFYSNQSLPHSIIHTSLLVGSKYKCLIREELCKKNTSDWSDTWSTLFNSASRNDSPWVVELQINFETNIAGGFVWTVLLYLRSMYEMYLIHTFLAKQNVFKQISMN